MKNESREHWDEILELVKDANENVEPDAARLADLRTAVYAHIDKEFPTDVIHQSSVNDNKVLKAIDWLRWKILTPVPAMAMAAVLVLVAAGIFSSNDTYFDLPDTILVANLDAQIEAQGGSRGLVSSRTALRAAFINGALQAHTDLSGSEGAGEADSTDVWYREGFQIEVIHLAAKQAVNTRSSEVLQVVLRHFGEMEKHNKKILENTDVRADYLSKRLELNDVSDLTLPDSWDHIYRVTRALKVQAH